MLFAKLSRQTLIFLVSKLHFYVTNTVESIIFRLLNCFSIIFRCMQKNKKINLFLYSIILCDDLIPNCTSAYIGWLLNTVSKVFFLSKLDQQSFLSFKVRPAKFSFFQSKTSRVFFVPKLDQQSFLSFKVRPAKFSFVQS